MNATETIRRKGNVEIGAVVHVFSLIVTAACAILMLFVLLVTGMSPVGLIGYFSLLLFYVMLPGYVVARRVADRESAAQILAFSASFGIALLVLFYFLDELLVKYVTFGVRSGLASLLYQMGMRGVATNVSEGVLLGLVANPVVSVFSIVFLVRDVRSREVKPRSLVLDIRVAAVMAAVMSAAIVSIYARVSISPDLIGALNGYHDVLWMISNDASLASGWPADGFQYMGKSLKSNLLAEVVRASLGRASGIRAAEMYGMYSTFIAMPLCVCAIHALGERYFKNADKAAFATFTFFFVRNFSTALFHLPSIVIAAKAAKSAGFFSAVSNILYSPNGHDLAIPVIALAAILVLDIVGEQRPKPIRYVALFVLAAIMTGAKFVFAVCFMASIAATASIRLLQKRSWADASRLVIVLVVVIAAFLPVYFTVVRGSTVDSPATAVAPAYPEGVEYEEYEVDGYSYDKAYSGIELGASVKNTSLFSKVSGVLGLSEPEGDVLAAALIPVHFLLQLILVALPFVIWLVSRLRRLRSVDTADLFLGGIALCGVLVYYVLRVDGNSQGYFFSCASVFINLLGAGWLYEHFKSFNVPLKVLVALCLAIGMGSALGVTANHSFTSVAQLKIAMGAKAKRGTEPHYGTITSYEYQAMSWIRENTDPHAVLAIDRHFQKEPPDDLVPEPNQVESRYYYYTAFSERQAFLGAWAYLPRTAVMQQQIIERLVANDALYSNECLNRREIMEGNGISYVVVSRFVHPDLKLSENEFEVVFENRDVTVYELA